MKIEWKKILGQPSTTRIAVVEWLVGVVYADAFRPDRMRAIVALRRMNGVVVSEAHATFGDIEAAMGEAERMIRDLVAPFGESAAEEERAACAKIAGDIAEINLTALNRLFDPSNGTVRVVEARIETANAIAQRILERKGGAK